MTANRLRWWLGARLCALSAVVERRSEGLQRWLDDLARRAAHGLPRPPAGPALPLVPPALLTPGSLPLRQRIARTRATGEAVDLAPPRDQ